MLNKQKNSAKFKKDYVAYLAILIFLVVVCSEIALAVWLPMQMRSANAWAEQVSLQRMIDNFDNARRCYQRRLRKVKNDEAIDEMMIAKETLDHNARFLRANQANLSRDMVHLLSEDYRTFIKQSGRYYDTNPALAYYCFKKKLDATKIIQDLSDRLQVKKQK